MSSFHWGTGSGMAGIELEEDFLHDAVVDVASGRAVGVNGIDITGCDITDGRIRLTLNSSFAWARKPMVVFRGVAAAQQYRIVVNGADAGIFRGKSLSGGIPVPVPGPGSNGAAVRIQ